MLIISAICLKVQDPLPDGSLGFAYLGKEESGITLISGIAFLVGVLSGGCDVLKPLNGLRGPSVATTQNIGSPELQFKKVRGLSCLQAHR